MALSHRTAYRIPSTRIRRRPREGLGSSSPTEDSLDSLIPNILIVDDEPLTRSQLERLYTHIGYTVRTAVSAEEAIEQLTHADPDAVITDIRLPGMDGVELIAHIRKHYPDMPVIAITGHGNVDTAVKVLKHGASDFVVKPFDLAAIEEITRSALDNMRVHMEIRHLRRCLKNGSEFRGMLSKTPEMHRILEVVRMVAPTDMTVSIEGETGTGKELVANAVHYLSHRKNGPFVTINCAGFPESLLESELFGYEKGAFTGAEEPRAGKLELANAGTLFLDEIESMSVVMQGKLLRVLEDQKVQRLGGRSGIHVDMRVIAATNVPLKDLVQQGKMRSDFYYRINVVPLRLIPLRHRKVDIPLLVQDYIHNHPVATSKGVRSVSKKVIGKLMDYQWPGNIRELQNVIERAIVLAKGPLIEEIDLGDGLSPSKADQRKPFPNVSLNEWLTEQEKQYLAQKLHAFEGNVGLTAMSCGIGVRTLSRKIQLYGLDRSSFKP